MPLVVSVLSPFTITCVCMFIDHPSVHLPKMIFEFFEKQIAHARRVVQHGVTLLGHIALGGKKAGVLPQRKRNNWNK